MSLKHLATGSEFPQLKEGTLRLYSMVFCPYAERPRLVLAAKNIPYETVNINLKKKPEWFLKINPTGQVPVLQHGKGDERVLPESLVVSEYLDNLYPENRLQPTDAFQNAFQKLLIERFSKVTTCFYKLLMSSEPNAAQDLFESLRPYENALHGLEFFGGEKPGFVDYMLWPWFERFGFLKSQKNLELSKDEFPNLTKYIERMYEQPAVKRVALTTATYQKFYSGYLAGEEPDYDAGIETNAAA